MCLCLTYPLGGARSRLDRSRAEAHPPCSVGQSLPWGKGTSDDETPPPYNGAGGLAVRGATIGSLNPGPKWNCLHSQQSWVPWSPGSERWYQVPNASLSLLRKGQAKNPTLGIRMNDMERWSHHSPLPKKKHNKQTQTLKKKTWCRVLVPSCLWCRRIRSRVFCTPLFLGLEQDAGTTSPCPPAQPQLPPGEETLFLLLHVS